VHTNHNRNPADGTYMLSQGQVEPQYKGCQYSTGLGFEHQGQGSGQYTTLYTVCNESDCIYYKSNVLIEYFIIVQIVLSQAKYNIGNMYVYCRNKRRNHYKNALRR